ncbi:MAG: DNA primase [Eubacteriaceae bacterium]
MNRSYSNDIIQQIITENDIVGVISQYVTLVKRGTSLKCRCPFHNEKTPSFVVSPDKQLYHCFGCGAGGNVINFIMEIENLSFIDALKVLADRSGIVLPDDYKYDDKINKKKQKQYLLHRDAAIFYYKNLLSNVQALEYLHIRGIEKNTIKWFGLGYAPILGDSLLKYLLYKKYDINDINESGLIIKSDKGKGNYYDRFRDRIIFPIQTVTEKLIGFGGRVINDEKYPKYLNSPETVVFLKGKQLYGLNYAKKYISNDQIILTEGYMDVISLYQKGVKNVVASLGTALTRDQGMLLKRYAKEVIIAYDGDEAGQKAAVKAMEIIKNCNLDVKILLLPELLDPDEYIKSYGKEAFETKKDGALTDIEYKILKLKEKYNTKSIDGKINFTKEVSNYLAQIDNEIEIEAYLNKIAKEVEISKEAIKVEIEKVKAKKHKKNSYGNYRNEKQHIKNAYILAQEKILGQLITNKEYSQYIKTTLEIEYFSKGIYKTIANYLYKNMGNNNNFQESKFITTIEDKEDVKIASSIFTMNEEIIEVENINSYINTIKKNKMQNDIVVLQEHLMSAESEEEKNKIYYEIIEIKRQLEKI